MARKRYTEEQIISVLNGAETGGTTAEPCRRPGMRESTFYKWKSKCTGLTLSELKMPKIPRGREPASEAGCGHPNRVHHWR